MATTPQPSTRRPHPIDTDVELAALVEQLSLHLQQVDHAGIQRLLVEHPNHAEALQSLLPTLQVLMDLQVPPSQNDATSISPTAPPLGDFRLIREVGRGGMGVVYEAEQLSLSRRVALKILPFAAVLDPQRLQRFKNEALAAAQLDHPNIVEVYGVGCERCVHFYAMRYIEGQTLAAVIAALRRDLPKNGLSAFPRQAEGDSSRSKTINKASETSRETEVIAGLSTLRTHQPQQYFRRIADLGVQIADALHHAHQAGIIHRDIKPANVMLDHHGKVWITDFGLAHMDNDQSLTLSGDLVGTVRYMSPEQADRDSVSVDHRSDIYSLGVTLYELLTLEPAYAGHDAKRLLREITETEPIATRRMVPAIPVDLDTIIRRSMSKLPADRYRTAGELAADLRRFLADEPIRARRVSQLGRAWRWYKRSPMVAGLLTAVLLLSLAVLMLSALFGQQERKRRIVAEKTAQDARWQQYLSDMHSGLLAWDNGDLKNALDLVNRHWPEPGDPDHRGFEWYYLWRQTHPEDDTITLRHEGAVNAVAFSPDGKMLATGGMEFRPTIRLWDAKSGRLVRELSGHADRISSVSFSHDGQTLASGSYDHTAGLWDVESGRLLQVLRGHEHVLTSLLFFDDSQKLATGAWDHTVRIWDVDSGQPLNVLRSNNRMSLPHAVVDGNRLFVEYRQENRLSLWDLNAAQLVREWVLPNEGPAGILLSADKKQYLLGQTESGTISQFDLEAGQERTLVANTHWPSFHSFQWGHVRNWLAAGGLNGVVELWDVTSRRPITELRGHQRSVIGMAFSPDNSQLATASRDGTAKIWNLNRLPLPAILQLNNGHVLDLSIDRHNRWVAVSGWGRIELLDIASRTRLPLLRRGFGWTSVAFSPADDLLATSNTDGTVALWNVSSFASDANDLSQQTIEIGHRAYNLAISTDGKLLACGCENQEVVIVDIAARRILRKISFGGSGDIADVSFIDNSRRLVVACPNGRLFIVDPLTGERIREITTNTPVDCVDVSPDGQVLAVGDWSTPLSLWSIATGKRLKLVEHDTNVMDVTFSPDGKLLATTGQDHRVRLWDVGTGMERAELRGHLAWATQVAFSSDGTALISGSDDGSVRFWMAASAQDVRPAESMIHPIDDLIEKKKNAASRALALQSSLQLTSADSDSVWDEWFRVNAVDLQRSAQEILANWPAMKNEAPSRGTDMRWVLERLASDGVVRINCGGSEYVATNGIVWSRDRCWERGNRAESDQPVEQTEHDPLYQTERWFPVTDKRFGYSIPLPTGRYEVKLHFTEMGDPKDIPERRFDVLVEANEIAKNYRPPLRAPDVMTVVVKIIDGFLDIRFRHRVENPNISAIELMPIDQGN